MGCRKLKITDYYRLNPTTSIPDTHIGVSAGTSETANSRFKPVVSVSIPNYRYYSPELGRWTKRDPLNELGHALLKLKSRFLYYSNEDNNPYRHTDNNPINRIDINGEIAPVIIIAIAALIEGLLHAYLAEKAEEIFPDPVICNSLDDIRDRERHCWVNCASTRIHLLNPAPALIASTLKEIKDLGMGVWNWNFWETVKDSAADAVANFYGQANALKIWKSCEDICKECPTNRK